MCGTSRREALSLVIAALFFAALDTGLHLIGPQSTGWAGPHAGLFLQLAADATLPLLFRFPRFVAGCAIAAALAMLASDVFAPGLLMPVNPLTLSTVPSITPILTANLVRATDRTQALVLVGVLAVLASRPWNPTWNTTPAGLLTTAVPALWMLYLQARRQLVQSLRDRAERAERERELLAEQARAEERRRLAAEMHDVVTHRLSLMVLHAGALGVTSPDPSVRAAAEDIRTAGTQALDELRDLVGVLRGAQTEIEQAAADRPNVPDPATLIAESSAAGMSVEYTVDGDADQISPTVARTAYRVVQEALTNARKHAPGARVEVELRYRADGLRVQVRNTAPTRPPDPALAGSGSGAGLLGLRQRIELIGGSLHASPVPGGGYRLNAILPAYVPTAESAGHGSGDRRR
ncbi:histidine kinase [Amycolatopsis anabasis]|uniref:sensor histidine kinase n=1 Tax=Amycolatopsis anabasis TaxID=1840409 RepID=UPI00131BA917